MHIQHSPIARYTRSQARAQAVLTPTPRAPLDGTPKAPQLRAQFGRSSTIKGEGRGPRRSNSFSGVVGGFPGLSRVLVKMVKRKGLMVLKVSLLLWGNPKVMEGQI
ncbi:hypothetical protein O181_035152 [Austropuccinia psidii MF-1]|uniref:Uncharacterized protein n=1 Tax=Austropuccinia psidii MF-1 TaxID=1389203 RepID=A0A9Q3D829_9BASI|nr:hypothetical protein [Austropuccinia psidii MF-1]